MPLAQTTENTVTKKRKKSLLEGRRSFQLEEGSNGPIREQSPLPTIPELPGGLVLEEQGSQRDPEGQENTASALI